MRSRHPKLACCPFAKSVLKAKYWSSAIRSLLQVECSLMAPVYLLHSHTYWKVLLNGTEHNIHTEEHPRAAHTSTAVNNHGSCEVAPPHITNILYEAIYWGRGAMIWPVGELQLFYNVASSCLLRERESEGRGWGGGEKRERARRKIYQLFILEISFHFLIYQ